MPDNLSDIRNIYCVGRNYRMHAAELGNEIPEQPMLFIKPTHALALMDGGSISLPGGRGEIHYEAELVVQVKRTYEKGMQAEDWIGNIALGIDFTLRDVQSELKRKGHPWLAAKGFKNSAAITELFPFPGVDDLFANDFSLWKNGVEVQRGNAKEMIFSLNDIVSYCSLHFGLDQGDIIYTGTPAGVGPLADGDVLDLRWGDRSLGKCRASVVG